MKNTDKIDKTLGLAYIKALERNWIMTKHDKTLMRSLPSGATLIFVGFCQWCLSTERIDRTGLERFVNFVSGNKEKILFGEPHKNMLITERDSRLGCHQCHQRLVTPK
jgi:hypothetical protein